MKNIVLKIEEMGLKIIAVIRNINALNRKIMPLFANKPKLSKFYKHRAGAIRGLYYVVDPVHL